MYTILNMTLKYLKFNLNGKIFIEVIITISKINKYWKYLISILNLTSEMMIFMRVCNAHEMVQITVKLVLNIFIASVFHSDYSL